MKPDQRARRCKCHKQIINVEKDENGIVVTRYCMATRSEIGRDQTYLSTWGSDVEIKIDQGPEFQRGIKINE